MQLKCTWCCSQLLYHNKNRSFSQSWRVPCWGMICHKSTLSVLKTIMLFWKCLTWPESEQRMHSRIFEPDWRLSSDLLSSHRMLLPRHHCRANGGEKGDRGIRAGSRGCGPGGIPIPVGQPGGTRSMPGSHCQVQSDPQDQHFLTMQHLVIGMPSAYWAVL